MSLIKYFDKALRINRLILLRATGTPEEFAGKLGIRRSTLFRYLQEMREMDLKIKYSFAIQSYYYVDGKSLKIEIIDELTKKNMVAETH